MSPNLSRALQNQNVKTASYTLPDGTIVDPRQQVTHDSWFFIQIILLYSILRSHHYIIKHL